MSLLGQASDRTESVQPLLQQTAHRLHALVAYRQYCSVVASHERPQTRPFHSLATEGKVHVDKTHTWHTENLTGFCVCDPELLVPWVDAVRDILAVSPSRYGKQTRKALYRTPLRLWGQGLSRRPSCYFHSQALEMVLPEGSTPYSKAPQVLLRLASF